MNLDVKICPITCSFSTVHVIEHSMIKEKILSMIDLIPSDNKNPNISKVDWFSSTEAERPWISYVKPILDSYMKVIGEATGYENATITDLWYQQYIEGNFHDWHIHGQQMVGVYYVELPEGSPKTELVPPFLHDTKIIPDINEGNILIFPSAIPHRAPTIKNGRKTIISWNFHWEQNNPKTFEVLNLL